MAVVVGAEQAGEAGGGVEARQAEPVDRAVAADQGAAAPVADQCVVLDGQRHARTLALCLVTDPVERVHRLLRAAGQTVATAESLTGGRLGRGADRRPRCLGRVRRRRGHLRDRAQGVAARRAGAAHRRARRGLVGVRAGDGRRGAGADRRDVRRGDDRGRRPVPSRRASRPARSSSGSPARTWSRRSRWSCAGSAAQIQDRTCREALTAFEQVLRREETPLG